MVTISAPMSEKVELRRTGGVYSMSRSMDERSISVASAKAWKVEGGHEGRRGVTGRVRGGEHTGEANGVCVDMGG